MEPCGGKIPNRNFALYVAWSASGRIGENPGEYGKFSRILPVRRNFKRSWAQGIRLEVGFVLVMAVRYDSELL